MRQRRINMECVKRSFRYKAELKLHFSSPEVWSAEARARLRRIQEPSATIALSCELSGVKNDVMKSRLSCCSLLAFDFNAVIVVLSVGAGEEVSSFAGGDKI